ncbi:DUF2958 domain-containing protein [soil metagenome]
MSNWRNMLRAVDLIALRQNWDETLPLKGTSLENDYEPIVKLFNPAGVGTWLVTECDEDGLAFGLADLGSPELGYFDLGEIAAVRMMRGHVRIEQDIHFAPDKPISAYAEEARRQGRIVA